MSSNSSKKVVWFRRLANILAIVALSSWAIASVFAFGGLIGGLMLYGGLSQLGLEVDESSALFQATITVMIYAVGAAVLLIEPYAIRQMTLRKIQSLVGLARKPILKDIGIGLLGWGVYIILSLLSVALIASFAPAVNLDQEQETGFGILAGQFDLLAAFVVIVIAAPIVEEIVFRGYLYGSLRPRMPWWLAAIIVSLLFGAVHGQVNVAIDTFILSLVLCYLRDKTGAIWSGIFVHALKNSVAFWLLFLAPDWIRRLLMGL